jgi:hypothetical protein
MKNVKLRKNKKKMQNSVELWQLLCMLIFMLWITLY